MRCLAVYGCLLELGFGPLAVDVSCCRSSRVGVCDIVRRPAACGCLLELSVGLLAADR